MSRVIGTPDKPARCPDAGLLIDGWSSTDAWAQRQEQQRRPGVRVSVPWPAELYRCPPCTRKDATPWLVCAGTHHAVIYAGCETAARHTMAHRLRRHDTPDGMTARAATSADVARWHQMLTEQETTH